MNRLFFILLAAAAIVTGCSESVSPVLDSEKPYTMWGFLDPTSGRQQIRVFAVDGVLEQISDAPMGAMVRLLDDESGQETVFSDSVVSFADGTFGHVFVADMGVAFNRDYTLVAESPDGLESRANVTTPPVTTPAVGDITHSRGFVRIRTTWAGAPQVLGVRLLYYVNFQRPSDAQPIHRTVEIVSGTIEGDAITGFDIVIDPALDFGTILEQELISAGRPGFTLALDSIDVRPFIGSRNWVPPGGVFDPELLVQPGTFSNVVNGFGFVGGGYEDSMVVQLPDDAARDAGFTVR